MHDKDQIPQKNSNNANHISSSIIVLQTNTMTLGKSVIKCPRKPEGVSPRDFHKSSRGLRGHLITNFPNVMVLVYNTMIDEEIWLALFRILLGIWCLLMHVNDSLRKQTAPRPLSPPRAEEIRSVGGGGGEGAGEQQSAFADYVNEGKIRNLPCLGEITD